MEKKNCANAMKLIGKGIDFMCSSVGSKIAVKVALKVMPEATLFTKIGAALIGGGLGEIAVTPMIQAWNKVCDEMLKEDDDSEKKDEESTEEVVAE